MTSRYNPPQTMSFSKRLIGLVLVLLSAAHAATNWDASSAQLAKQIAAVAGPGTASLTIRNNSSLAAEEIPAIRRSLEASLRDAGLQLRSEDNAATAIRVTFSENVRGYVWVSEVQQGSETRVAMIEVERSGAAPSATPAQSVSLRKTPLWSQPQPMIDAARITIAAQEYIAVLEPARVVIYRAGTPKPEAVQTLVVAGASAPSRDPRGRLILASDHLFDVYVPGVTCASNSTLPLYLNCKEADDPWPIGSQKAFFNSSRNYFTGAMAPGIGRQIPPFYSAAELPRSNYSAWIFAGINGQFRAADKVNDVPLPAASTRDWGSDIAAVRGCGTTTYLLASTAGAAPEDAIRAYEVADREPVAVSMPLEFPGSILSLWTAGQAATAVVKNDRTNSYEAYNVAVACSL